MSNNFDSPKEAAPEAAGHSLFQGVQHLLGAILDRIDMAPNDEPLPYIREYVDGLRERGSSLISNPEPVTEGAFEEWWDLRYASSFEVMPGIMQLGFREIAHAAWNAARAR